MDIIEHRTKMKIILIENLSENVLLKVDFGNLFRTWNILISLSLFLEISSLATKVICNIFRASCVRRKSVCDRGGLFFTLQESDFSKS